MTKKLSLLVAVLTLFAACSDPPPNQLQVTAKQYVEISNTYRITFSGYSFDAAGGMNVTFACDCETTDGRPLILLIKVNAGHPSQTILQKASVSEEFKFNYSEERLDAKSTAPESSGSHLQFVSQKGGQST